MTHAYAARGARQTAVLTAIVGFHFAVFLIIVSGLVPRAPPAIDEPIPVTRLLPPEKPKPTVYRPDNYEPGTVVVVVDEPVVAYPDFEKTGDAPTVTIDSGTGSSGSSGATLPASEYVAPRLRTRSGSLAALIDSCYPAASRRLNEEGKVIAVVTIGARGSALGSRVANSSGFPRLDAASDCVVRKLEFVAGRRDGQEVVAEAMLPIVFRLD